MQCQKLQCQVGAPHAACSLRPKPSLTERDVSVRASPDRHESVASCSRRGLVVSTPIVGTALLGLPDLSLARATQAAPVGTYLPEAGIDDLVLFVPDAKKTPALRAGTVDPTDPYKFALPPTWREGKVANILSGNYCQPRCDEPWTEVIFEESSEGRAALLACPLFKLTTNPQAAIDEIGTPEGILQSIGAYITGTVLEEEDVVSIDTKKLDDSRTYYYYEVNSPFATFGPHVVTAATTKGEVALLFIVSANDRQWPKSESRIRKMVASFRA